MIKYDISDKGQGTDWLNKHKLQFDSLYTWTDLKSLYKKVRERIQLKSFSIKFWSLFKEVLLTDKNINCIMGNGNSSEEIRPKVLPADTTECFAKVIFFLKMHPCFVVYPNT